LLKPVGQDLYALGVCPKALLVEVLVLELDFVFLLGRFSHNSKIAREGLKLNGLGESRNFGENGNFVQKNFIFLLLSKLFI
jgi:hypothetical protein